MKLGLGLLALCGTALADKCTKEDVEATIKWAEGSDQYAECKGDDKQKECECKEIWDVTGRLEHEGVAGKKCSDAHDIVKEHFWAQRGCVSDDICAGPDNDGLGMALYMETGCLTEHGIPDDLDDAHKDKCCGALQKYMDSGLKEACHQEVKMIGGLYYGCFGQGLPDGCSFESADIDAKCPRDCDEDGHDEDLPACEGDQEDMGEKCNSAECHDYVLPMIQSEEMHPQLECLVAIHTMYGSGLTVDMLKMHLTHMAQRCGAFGEVDQNGCAGEDLCPVMEAFGRCEEMQDGQDKEMCFAESQGVMQQFSPSCQMCMSVENEGCGGDFGGCGGGGGGDDWCVQDCMGPPTSCDIFDEMIHEGCLADCDADFLRPHLDGMGCDIEIPSECHSCDAGPTNCDEFFEMASPGGCADCLTAEFLMPMAEQMGCEDALEDALDERDDAAAAGDDTDGDEGESPASVVGASVFTLAVAAVFAC